jgi:hypothetical protein
LERKMGGGVRRGLINRTDRVAIDSHPPAMDCFGYSKKEV